MGRGIVAALWLVTFCVAGCSSGGRGSYELAGAEITLAPRGRGEVGPSAVKSVTFTPVCSRKRGTWSAVSNNTSSPIPCETFEMDGGPPSDLVATSAGGGRYQLAGHRFKWAGGTFCLKMKAGGTIWFCEGGRTPEVVNSPAAVQPLEDLAGLLAKPMKVVRAGIDDQDRWQAVPESARVAPDPGPNAVSLCGLDVAPTITELECRQSLADTAPIAKLKQLSAVKVMGIKGTDLSGFAGHPTLSKLDLGMAEQVTDLGPLSTVKGATELKLWSAPVTDLSPLGSLAKLRRLDLFTCKQVADVTPLSKLTALRDLHLSSTAVADLTPLTSLTQLRVLRLNHTKVVDLSPLAKLTQLETLALNGTAVEDLSPLSGLTSLRRLSLRNTSVSDPSPLHGLPHLEAVNFDGTKVPKPARKRWKAIH